MKLVIAGWLYIVILLLGVAADSSRYLSEVNAEKGRLMREYHPKKVEYEEWRRRMSLWTDTGDRNYSAFMPEAACRELYESLRHPWKANARHYGGLLAGLLGLCAVIGAAMWVSMGAGEWIGKK